jgi:nucleoside-diphosphate-sugar epimerase
MSDETVLVTGGAGYIGSHLIRNLLERGYRVRVLDNFLYGDQGLAELSGAPGLEIREGDICRPDDMHAAVRGVRSVVALAALVGDAACDLDPDDAVAVNFESTRTTVQACREAGVGRLVFASSCSVYGANGSELLTEDSHLNPVSLYARTRVLSEQLLLQQRDSLEVVILRLSTVCGLSPRMRFDLMVNTITARAAIDGRVRVVGAPQWRPHIHVLDAAEAFALAVEAPGANVAGEILNVGGEHLNFTVGEIAERVSRYLPETRIEYADGNGDSRSYRVGFDRVRSRLGFTPQRSVDDAIEEVCQTLAAGTVVNYTDDVYHNLQRLRRVLQQRTSA